MTLKGQDHDPKLFEALHLHSREKQLNYLTERLRENVICLFGEKLETEIFNTI